MSWAIVKQNHKGHDDWCPLRWHWNLTTLDLLQVSPTKPCSLTIFALAMIWRNLSIDFSSFHSSHSSSCCSVLWRVYLSTFSFCLWFTLIHQYSPPYKQPNKCFCQICFERNDNDCDSSDDDWLIVFVVFTLALSATLHSLPKAVNFCARFRVKFRRWFSAWHHGADSDQSVGILF